MIATLGISHHHQGYHQDYKQSLTVSGLDERILNMSSNSSSDCCRPWQPLSGGGGPGSVPDHCATRYSEEEHHVIGN